MKKPLAGMALRSLALAAGLLSASACLAEERLLNLHNMNTGEKVSVVYKRDGDYLREGVEKLDWFLRDWRRDEAVEMDRRLYDTVWEVYRESGATAPIQVHSGYRSPATNSLLRKRSKAVARHSQHMSGTAIDFHIPGVPVDRLRDIALKMHDGGVGYYPNANNPFVHVDVAKVRHWPRMTRAQLAKIFPDGRTVHVPSDGRPLKGFKEALASIEQEKEDFLAHRAGRTYAALLPAPQEIPVPEWRPDREAERRPLAVASLPAIASAVAPGFPESAYVPAGRGISAFERLLAPPSALPYRMAVERKPLPELQEMRHEETATEFVDLGVGRKGPRLARSGSHGSEAPREWKIGGYL